MTHTRLSEAQLPKHENAATHCRFTKTYTHRDMASFHYGSITAVCSCPYHSRVLFPLPEALIKPSKTLASTGQSQLQIHIPPHERLPSQDRTAYKLSMLQISKFVKDSLVSHSWSADGSHVSHWPQQSSPDLSPRDLAIYFLHSVEVNISIFTYKSKQAVVVASEDAGEASCLDYLVYVKETGMYTGLSTGLKLLQTSFT
jgi:hypothetical protein